MPDFSSSRARQPAFAYPLSVLAVALTTWGLLGLEAWLSAVNHRHVRPYTIVYIMPIALLTLLGGRGPGFFTLALSALLSVVFLMGPHLSLGVAAPSNVTELALLLLTGALVVIGMDAMRRNVSALRQEQEAQARLRTVMDTSPVGMVTCDVDGTLRYANPAAERLWGHPLKAVGRDGWAQYRMLEPDGTPTPSDRTTLARVLAGEAPTLSREVILEQPDGTRLWVEASSTLMRDPQGRPIGGLVVMQDISARKRAQAEEEQARAQAEARAEREALLNHIGEMIRAASEPEEILRRATAALGEALGLDRCYFVSYDQQRDRAHLGPDWSRDPLPSIAGEYRMSAFRVNDDPAFLTGTVQAVADTQAGGADETMARLGLRALLRVALRRDGEVSALTGAMAHGPRAWTADEAALLAEAATQTRAALDLAQVRRREQAIAATLQDALRPRLPERVPGLDLADFYRPALDEAYVGGDFFDVFPLDKSLIALVVGDVSGKGLAAASQVATVRNMLRYALYRGTGVAEAVTEPEPGGERPGPADGLRDGLRRRVRHGRSRPALRLLRPRAGPGAPGGRGRVGAGADGACPGRGGRGGL